MDVRINRNTETLKIGIYRKPKHRTLFAVRVSNHPESAKRSVVRALYQRLDYVTLGEKERRKEEERIVAELQANGYPGNLSNRHQEKELETDTTTRKEKVNT